MPVVGARHCGLGDRHLPARKRARKNACFQGRKRTVRGPRANRWSDCAAHGPQALATPRIRALAFALLALLATSGAGCSSRPPEEQLAHLAAPESSWQTQTTQATFAPPRGHRGRAARPWSGYRKIGKPYQVNGRWYRPRHQPDYSEVGRASWYGPGFHKKRTANGEIYDMYRLTAAHRTLPLPSLVKVTNLENGRSLIVRVNDRGPYARNRILDLSKRAAELLGVIRNGTARVHVRYLRPAPLSNDDSIERAYLARQPWYRRRLASSSGQSGHASGQSRQ